jgi:hypothetical protein
MSDIAAFDWVCCRLERDTSLNRLESRGTLRVALGAAGLEARSATLEQMSGVIQNQLVVELATRGIDDPEDVCARLAAGLEGEAAHFASGAAAPLRDAGFGRPGERS